MLSAEILLHRRIDDPDRALPLLRPLDLRRRLGVLCEEPCQRIDVDPDLIVSLLLGFVKDQLQPPVQMRHFNIIHILLRAVAGVPHVADDVSRRDGAALRKSFRVRVILPEMRIVIIPSSVKAADADAPAAVLVPAQCLDSAGLDSYNRHSHLETILILKLICNQ